MTLFTILGLDWWKWFLFVDLPLSIIFVIVIAIKFPRIRQWLLNKQALKSFIKYEYDEDNPDADYDFYDDSYDDSHSELTASEKRKRTMLERYGVPYAFLLKDRNKK